MTEDDDDDDDSSNNNKNLPSEIKHVWNIKTEMVPQIIGATRTISESFRKCPRHILGKHEIEELHKRPYWALCICFVKKLLM